MKHLMKVGRLALLVCLAFAASGTTASPQSNTELPNWKVSAVGTGTVADFTFPLRTDIDAFSGTSSHLGVLAGTGYHVLNVVTGEFAGVAFYKAANGDILHVTYAGYIFPSGDANFPYAAWAPVEIVGGTGRFANATGGGLLTGGFTGGFPVGDYFFNVEGTLRTQ